MWKISQLLDTNLLQQDVPESHGPSGHEIWERSQKHHNIGTRSQNSRSQISRHTGKDVHHNLHNHTRHGTNGHRTGVSAEMHWKYQSEENEVSLYTVITECPQVWVAADYLPGNKAHWVGSEMWVHSHVTVVCRRLTEGVWNFFWQFFFLKWWWKKDKQEFFLLQELHVWILEREPKNEWKFLGDNGHTPKKMPEPGK